VDNSRDRIRQSLGQWIAVAAGQGAAVESMDEFAAAKAAARSAEKLLVDYGLKIVCENGVDYLAVANMHRGLSKIFENTQWGARPGAQGVWVQSLRRLPHLRPEKALWFGAASKATLIELKLCLASSLDAPPPAPEPLPPVLPDDPAEWTYSG
jgi:hypothetical protein